MKRNQLIVYSLIGLILLGLGLYRSGGDEKLKSPEVETELSEEGAEPGLLKDRIGPEQINRDFDGDEPGILTYSYDFDIEPIMTARCFSCHTKKDKVHNIIFCDYDSVLKFVKPGDLNSPIPKAISVNEKMEKYLSRQEARIIQEWVLNGAKQ